MKVASWLDVRRILIAALVAGLLSAACGGPAPSETPPPLIPQASTPQSTEPAQASGPAASADPNAAASIDALLASMAADVVARDRSGYLSLVDQSDPTFALEHGRWADEWAGPQPVARYSLVVTNLAVDGNTARGRITVTWVRRDDPSQRAATFDARFTRGVDGWRYAGEAWSETVVPHFRILVAPGLEGVVPGLAADLPDVYDRVTAALAYEPAAPLVIKLYADAPALVANTLLSLPDIRGWNEPGEALKLRYDPDDRLTPVVAHEFTHFICFDRAGTRRTRMPWWLEEGIATYVMSSFEGSAAPDRLARVVEWDRSGQLASWDALAVFETAPVDLWTYVYPQGYAMVRYVTETYGQAKRNAWLAAMATEMTIDQATPAVLGASFEDLDAGFRAWLRRQAASTAP